MRISLTDEQLVSLASRNDLTDEQRAAIAAAQARLDALSRLSSLSPAAAAFIADAVTEATTRGRLVYHGRRISNACRVCGKSPEPIRYKSGRRRGEIKAWGAQGAIELAYRFVTMQGHVTLGCCSDCMRELLPSLRSELRDVRAEVPDTLRADGRVRWKRRDRVCCAACGWSGHEGQLGLASTVMGNGCFRGVYPSCGKGGAWSGVITRTDGFEVVEAERGLCEVCEQTLRDDPDGYRCGRHPDGSAA